MKSKRKFHCYKHKDREAVAIFNKKYFVCQECVDEAMVAVLNAGEMLGIAFQGEPHALVIPQKKILRVLTLIIKGI